MLRALPFLYQVVVRHLRIDRRAAEGPSHGPKSRAEKKCMNKCFLPRGHLHPKPIEPNSHATIVLLMLPVWKSLH